MENDENKSVPTAVNTESEESSEFDSLDSHAEEKKLAKKKLAITNLEVEDAGAPIPDLSDEDLKKLIGYVKDMTTLYDLCDEDWNDVCDEIIKDFFMDITQPVLSIYFENEILKCNLGFPNDRVNDLMYFIRKPFEMFAPDNFHDNIHFGTVDDNIEGSLLKIIENIYAPIFFNITSLSESVRSDFCTHLHNFLAKLTDLHYKILGLTVIYIPNEGSNLTLDEAAKDKDLVKRLEGVLVHWTKQIKMCLADQKQLAPNELLRPVDEYEFWTYRYENLSGLNYQLQNKNLKRICEILKASHSSYITQFMKFVDDIDQNLIEAKSNIEHLQILIDPCKDLRQCATPNELPDKIPYILNLIRVIWNNSPYYNTKDKITTICRELTNEIIHYCTDYITLSDIFDGKTRKGIQMLESCIECCINYKYIYFLMAEAHSENSSNPWCLNNSQIFNHLDSFVQRCYDMIEVCECMITFGRMDETEHIPKPMFGTSKGKIYEAMCEKAEKLFFDAMEDVEKIKDQILDIQDQFWLTAIVKFRASMKNIEVIITNVTDNVFDHVAHVEESIEALGALYNYTKRESLEPLFNKKIRYIYKLFADEIRNVKNEMTNERNECYAMLPYNAGRAWLAHLKKNRLMNLKQALDDAVYIPYCHLKDDVYSQYEKQIKAINEFIKDTHAKWVESLDENFADYLNRPLINRSTIRPGLLECNIHRKLLPMCHEAKYWELLEIEVPFCMKQIYVKYDDYKLIYQKVLTVVMDYNKIIAALSDEERILFKHLISIVDKKIVPGIHSLTWNAAVSDEYIAECCQVTQELQEFLDDYKKCNLQIVKICEKICNFLFLDIPTSHVFDLKELEMFVETSVRSASYKLGEMYIEILKYLIVVYEGFESQINNMIEAWDRYIRKFDALLEQAIRIAIKNSLDNVKSALHGDASTGPNPLLKVEADLRNNRIDFEPSINDIAKLVSSIRPLLINAVRPFKRLSEKFKVYGERPNPFHTIIKEDRDCGELQKSLDQEVMYNVSMMHTYLKNWDPYRDMWEVDKDRFIARYEKQKPDAAAFDDNIGRYTEVANNVQLMESVTMVHFILLNASPLKLSITEHCILWQQKLCQLLLKIAINKVNEVYEYINTNIEKITHIPENLQEMQDCMELYEKLVAEAPLRSLEFDAINDQFLTLDKYEVEVPLEIRTLAAGIPARWEEYLEIIRQAEKMISFTKDTFRTKLLEQASDLKKNASNLLESFTITGPFSSDWSAKDALSYLANMREEIAKLREIERQLKKDLGIFNISQPDSPELAKLEKDLAALQLVWELTDQWDEAWERYRYGEFWKIETDDMEVTAQTLFKKLTRLARELKERNWAIVEHTRKRVDTFRRTLPLISDLKNTAMRARHWKKVKTIMNVDFDENSSDFKLENIIEMKMQDYAEQINEISNAATMELQIELGIKGIADTWAVMQIEITPYKDAGIYRIKSVDDAFTTLEENLVVLSTMKGTRFVEPFQKDVDYWEKTLSYIMETLENSLIVQRQWLYLENIFFGEDIKKQLPKESANFDDITNKWKYITASMFGSKNALEATHFQPPPYLFVELNKMNDRLELIQRELERYLETKRHIFPRFYFISNDDMLEILGNARKPEAVQPHLKKLFDNVNKVKLGKNANLGKTEVIGMFSEDGEYIDFNIPSLVDGPAELWLKAIEKTMRITLRLLLKPCRQALRKNLKTRDKWLLEWFGQLCNTSSLIQWTTDCTRTLMQCKIVESRNPMKKLRKKQKHVLAMLSDLSRRDLQKIQRLKVNALSIIEIHAKDVIDKMYKSSCMDVSAFEWFSQLRFYWDRDVDDCVIKQTNTSFRYSYEYIGNSGRLVITPLTDRCYITLTTALHLNRGGSPKGPAGTGKTETVKDLGKAIGQWVIVNNCSEGLDYKSMGKMFSGLAQTGAWGCFDEFNRINIEVLSVVAQQILSVLQAISQKLDRFFFEGMEIALKHTCGIFITMNPGYAGRTELPDNLKSMFRPISMIVPDTVIISENILFSDGFTMTKTLAKKVFTLYQLSMQQLSKQDHYDFGLRSMVALLRYAGRKRRAYPNLPEEEILYLAMRDMNIAKLTSDDTPLFNGIMSDIFPGVQIPVIDYEDFNLAIEEEMNASGLQYIKSTMIKIIQLYETKNSRHSVMILGKTYTGKTVTWKTLKGSMGRLKKLNKEGFQMVQEYPLNPKSLSLGELYGEYNLSTNEWLDGVLSAIMRKVCADETPEQKWILFDGPVDAVWIENMNSVMDDNKVLTLINSERITMPEQVSLLFEVGDLSVASPATVSRCGIVYTDYADLGWRPFVFSWIERQKIKPFQKLATEMFERYLDSLLQFKKAHCEEPVVCCELNLIISLCKLLEYFATKENGMDPNDMDSFETMGKMWFIFCMIWSICVTTDEAGRKKLDVFIREKEGIFPLKDTVYEYFIDVRNKNFVSWEDKLPKNWQYDPNWPFYKITVPTIDTVRYECIVGALLDAGHPVLMTGPVGTGKTSCAQSVVFSLDTIKYTILSINMSAQTTSNNVQETIESRVEKRTKGVYVPLGGKKMIALLDDLNMPAKDTYGSQPPLELLRQWLDYGFWYDRQKQWRTHIKDMLLLGAMGPPGGGRTVISERFQSCFNVINMTFPDETQITRIFDTMLHQHIASFDDEAKRTGAKLTEATIDLYDKVSAKMLPTPAKIHYLFNLRDISKIFQGLLRSSKDLQDSKPRILRLWIHECYRVFYDRLIDDKDREWFNETMAIQLGSFFEQTFHSLCPNKQVPIFGHFISAYGLYEDLNDMKQLRKHLEVQMEEYNASPGVVRIDLVLFVDAICHICKIIRVVSQPRGNMLLVGIGGSGRQSLSRISAYMCDYNTYQIEVKKNYGMPEFREDLKLLYMFTGVESKETAFLFNDTQVADESFLEVINNMLSSGEVSNLYKPDEFEDIKMKLFDAATKAGILQTTEAIYGFLIERVRKNMHLILCMSPVGDSFRNRLRQYPALVNCTTIDWFSDWPKAALLEVANKYLADVDFVATITGEKTGKRRESAVVSTQERLREATATIFAIIHDSVSQCSKRMLDEIKRHNYVTPTNYLELVTGYKAMLEQKRAATATQANKLRNGLSKIDVTRAAVEEMSVELEIAKEKVIVYQHECDEYMVIIMNQAHEASEQEKQVTADSIKIGEEEIQCMKLASIAQADLDLALPALEEALRALDALNKKDIAEVRSYGRPPQKVEMVMEAVMILKGCEISWAEAKRVLADPNFLQGLRDFDRNHVSEKTLKKIATYTTNDEFQPDKVGIVSLAAKSLCMWVRAIEKYAKVYRVVAPKQERLENAMASLKEKQEQLAAAKRKLDELSAMLARLRKEYEGKLREKEELERKAELLRLKLERAALLVECLSGEKDRWQLTVETLDEAFTKLPGDCLLATAFVSYVGPFTSIYREELQLLWITEVAELDVPHTDNFNVIIFLSDPIEIREWNAFGLPSDEFSVENGIIITGATRWPLVIDPQCQAQKWIKQMEHGLKVIDFGKPNFMKTVEKAVQYGQPVLLQNILEEMDPAISPILQKSLVKQGGQTLIKLSDKMVQFNLNFKFYITTKLSNPHYPPEISTKTTVVNFAVKEVGLEAQLLGIVVRKEQAQLEEQKDKLVTTIATGKRQLVLLEDELLRLLNETRGSLLDDEELVATLKNSKETSEAVKQSLLISEVTEVEIDEARNGYRPCAKRAAILFFVLYDMSCIDPMYQFSLDSYILLFISSIERSQAHPDLETRISILNEYHTYATYKNTCRGLFENHKLLFSFHMCIKILDAIGKVLAHEYNFLLRGGIVLDRDKQMVNPCTNWLTDICWDNITELDKIQGFHGVVDTFEQYPRDWQQWFINTNPENLPLIGEWEEICNEFQRLLFIRSLRQDRLSYCVSQFIMNNLGPQFVEPPVLDIRAVLDESLPVTPLIFVLSTGVDPTTGLLQLAENNGMQSRFVTLSLGQGQAPIATRMLEQGVRDGNWVFLANCHLSLSWMPALDKIVESIQTSKKLHPEFRLWLSSSPHPDFPISILQAGIKMTTEPPKGIKANLKRLYRLVTDEQFNACKEREKYRKLLFSLCYFHAILLERKKFQQLGWNIAYSFNDSDFEVSECLLTIYLDEYKETPWDALKYLIAGVNYGGHITDDWDRRLVTTYINQYFCDDALNLAFFRLSSLPTYFIPKPGPVQSYFEYINVLPNVDHPEAFGQHSNADITSLITEARCLCTTLLSLQIQASGSQTETKEDKVMQLASDVLAKMPSMMDYDATYKNIGEHKQPLDVVLLQEISRYNVLLYKILSSLEELQKSIQGLVVMSSELEDIFVCIYEGRVPEQWLKAYPSLKLLGNWTRDLILRVEHFTTWADTIRAPLLFWLTAYTFPTGFLTAVLQTAARNTQVPIDQLQWEFEVLTIEEFLITSPPPNGVYVRGMFLEGAGWDKKGGFLIEAQPMQLVYPMPLIHFKPMENVKKRSRGFYICPVYYFPIRAGVQGRPAFIVAVDLKCSESSDYWVKRGTAMLLSLAN